MKRPPALIEMDHLRNRIAYLSTKLEATGRRDIGLERDRLLGELAKRRKLQRQKFDQPQLRIEFP
jgi:hypothetical protein